MTRAALAIRSRAVSRPIGTACLVESRLNLVTAMLQISSKRKATLLTVDATYSADPPTIMAQTMVGIIQGFLGLVAGWVWIWTCGPVPWGFASATL